MRCACGLVTVAICLVGTLLIGQANPQSANDRGVPTEKHTATRTRQGLLFLVDGSPSAGSIVKDLSQVDKPLDLRIANTSAVRRSPGSLEVRAPTLIRSDETASRIADAIRRSGELTIEAWIRPATTKQSGPARIITLSKNPNERNFTLGQEGDRFEVRLRTTKTSANGLPALSTSAGSLTDRRMHVVYTFDASSTARIYLNGKKSASRKIGGKPSNWSRDFPLTLANEMTLDRPWLGEIHLVAIYSRALSSSEIEQHFAAGVPAVDTAAALMAQAMAVQHFKTQIAPLLARRCLECHGWKSKRGGLDLSRKDTAFKSGTTGKSIVPGKAMESLVWKLVKSEEMPRKRSPLSSREKELLRKWIDDGAIWPVEVIDQATYAQDHTAPSNWTRRLTVPEYIETVRIAVGIDVARDARQILPPDLRADGFSNTAYNLTVDLGHVEAYARLAKMIVERMNVETFAARYTKSRELTDANMRKLISEMGKWLLRGPLREKEIGAFLQVSQAVAKEGGDFKEAVSYLLEAMLQSPRFIYRLEAPPSAATAQKGDYELASRLSYILWGGPPDQELLRAAEAGELADRKQVEKQVGRMLRDPRVIERSCRFLSEWFNLDRLSNLQPNPKRFPNWTTELAADMRDETLAFFREVAWKQKRPLSDLFNAQVTFATPGLAKHYALKPASKGLSKYDLSPLPSRGGLLTQASVLTVGGDEASMVARGLFIFHHLLGGHVGDPPPCVDTTPVPTKPGLSQRAIAMTRITNPNCSACHSKFEPLAFGLEPFDGLGAYHEKDEHGNKLRDDGEILFPGEKQPVSFRSSAELMTLLAKSESVRRTITRKLTQFALGRPLVAADEPVLDMIHETAWKKGGTYESLITAIVTSDLVQKTPREKKP